MNTPFTPTITKCARCPNWQNYHEMFDTSTTSSVKNPRICRECFVKTKREKKVSNEAYKERKKGVAA